MKPLSNQQIKALDLLAKRAGSTDLRWIININESYKCRICNKILSGNSIFDTEERCNIIPDIIIHGTEHLKSLNIFT